METVRTEQLLGNNKVIVGNKYTDLVLETLGKIYIKTGNQSVVLDNLIASIMGSNGQEIIFVNSTSEMETMEYPGDGKFVYNKLTNTLYISLDSRYIQLIQVSPDGSPQYVNKKGDTMTGQLEIITVSPPLIVSSSQLVKNFNAEYLNSYSSSDFARKNFDEYINGNWTFRGKNVSENNWIFKENTRFYKDIVSTGSLSSLDFSSGFGGYGWRLDGDTNTLTVDNLVVRKVMQVYEMVINQISATNGSLWVSNATTCEEVFQPLIVTKEEIDSVSVGNLGYIFEPHKYYLITSANVLSLSVNRDTNNLGSSSEEDIGIVTERKSLSSPSYINNTSKTFVNYKYLIYINDLEGLRSDSSLTSTSLLYNENYLKNSKYVSLYYIYKQNYVTEWDSNNNPVTTYSISTFNKDEGFFSIPRNSSQVIKIKPFYKYFGLDASLMQAAVNSDEVEKYVPKMFVFNTDIEQNPTLKPGDIVRCQKFQDNEIKYYDGVITAQIETRTYIIQLADSIFDTYTEISYNEDGSLKSREEKNNSIMYNKTAKSFDANTGEEYETYGYLTDREKELRKLASVSPKDDLVQMGNIANPQRQHSIYITSTDDQSPYIEVLSGLNRPDYSVIYDEPVYKKIKVFIKQKGDIFVEGEADNYYYQRENPEAVNFNQKPSFISNNKKFPLIYITLEKNYTPEEDPFDLNPEYDYINIYINDGEQNTIPSDTSRGYFITNYPTEYSIRDNGINPTKITKVRLGNLNGIYNDIFGDKQPYGFGLYSENVFLTGEFYLNNGQSVVEFSKDQINLAIKNVNIGGANLIPNSKIKESFNSYGDDLYKREVTLEQGQEYTFSMNGRCNQQALDNSYYLVAALYYSQDSQSDIPYNDQVLLEIRQTKTTTVYKTFKAQHSGLYYIRAYMFPKGGNRNGEVTINWYKLEKGNKPTDWTPHEDDIGNALLDTGINIKDKFITLTANTTKIQTNEGDPIAMFTIDEYGNPYLAAELIKADSIIVDQAYNERFTEEFQSKGLFYSSPIYTYDSDYLDSLSLYSSIGYFENDGSSLNILEWDGFYRVETTVINNPTEFATQKIELPEKISNCTFTAVMSTSQTLENLGGYVYIVNTKQKIPLIITSSSQNSKRINMSIPDNARTISIIFKFKASTTADIVGTINYTNLKVPDGYNWALFKDGTGQLARNNINWDTEGNVNITGILNSIGGNFKNCTAENFIAQGTFQTNNDGDRIIISSSSNSIVFKSGNFNAAEMFFYDYGGFKNARINLNANGGETLNLSPDEFYLYVFRPEVPVGTSSTIEIEIDNTGIDIKNLTSNNKLSLSENSIRFEEGSNSFTGITNTYKIVQSVELDFNQNIKRVYYCKVYIKNGLIYKVDEWI